MPAAWAIYCARDRRLRTIAVKVLAPNLSRNPEYRQRFEREGRTVAALSHPHICQVYDIGAQKRGPQGEIMPFATRKAGGSVGLLAFHADKRTSAATDCVWK